MSLVTDDEFLQMIDMSEQARNDRKYNQYIFLGRAVLLDPEYILSLFNEYVIKFLKSLNEEVYQRDIDELFTETFSGLVTTHNAWPGRDNYIKFEEFAKKVKNVLIEKLQPKPDEVMEISTDRPPPPRNP